MGKRKDIRRDQVETPEAAADATIEAKLESSPPMSPASAEEPLEAAPKAAPAPVETNTFKMPDIDLAATRTSGLEPRKAEPRAPRPLEEPAPAAANRFPILAGSVSLAAAIGAVIGSLVSMGFAGPGAPATGADANLVDVTRSLQGNLAQVTTDVAALKASLDGSSRLANSQLSKIAERLDRSERAQTEPAAKISAIVDSLARVERRIAPLPAQDVTGSVTDNRPAATPVAQEAPKPLVLEGWVLRDTYRGRALVENRDVLYEVSAGSTLPGVGRVEKIAQQNGRWVVVTPKGLILSMR